MASGKNASSSSSKTKFSSSFRHRSGPTKGVRIQEEYDDNNIDIMNINLELDDQLGDDDVEDLLPGASTSSDGQTQLTSRGSTGEVGMFQFNQKTCRQHMINWMMLREIPFKQTEDSYLENWIVNNLNPAYKKISRKYVKRENFKLFKQKKCMLQATFSSLDHCVALTCDKWTSPINQDYYCVTAHWIDDDWVIQKRILTFKCMKVDYTSWNIFERIFETLQKFCCVDKVLSISFDNDVNNDFAARELLKKLKPPCNGAFFHVKCLCQILNLCVQQGLQVLQSEIVPIRNALLYIKTKPKICQEFKAFCIENGKSFSWKRFKMDCPTRWNSTYEMLIDAYPYSTYLTRFLNAKMGSELLTSSMWDNCYKLSELLKYFYEAIVFFSGVYYPTVHMVLQYFVNIVAVFHEYKNDAFLKDTIEAMKKHWLEYFIDIPPIYLVASALDPNVKFSGTQQLLKAYYHTFLGMPHIPVLNISALCDHYLRALYKLYCGLHSGKVRSTTPSYGPQMGDATNLSSSSHLSPAIQILKRARATAMSVTEVDDYANTSFEPSESILEWWKNRMDKFPILSIIAQEILVVPVSTVASKSAFSASKRMISEKLARLAPKAIEVCVCNHDWTLADKRMQHQPIKSSDDEVLTEDDE